MKKKLEKAIRHFECMRDDNIVVLNSGFGTKENESNLLYRNRKMYAELAIEALEKQVAKKVINRWTRYEPNCGDWDGDFGTCPNCTEEWLEELELNYCPKCGQKLDWSEADENKDNN